VTALAISLLLLTYLAVHHRLTMPKKDLRVHEKNHQPVK
jgi:hypothetical protein